MNWLRSSLRKWLGIGHEAELNNTVERLVARVGLLEANKAAVPVAKQSVMYSKRKAGK